MVSSATAPSAERILYLLKTRGPQTAMALGEALEMSSMGARQHLARLQSRGLVESFDQREQVGRPRRYWRLTERGHGRFPDRHEDLTIVLIDSVRELFGTRGLEALIVRKERDDEARYRSELRGCRTLGARLRRLAELRRREGYMADVERCSDGSWLLVENHCPICAAATRCQAFCRSELTVFRRCLGEDVSVERVDHLPAGARRCAYRIQRRGKRVAAGADPDRS